jgi:hypothetical protein
VLLEAMMELSNVEKSWLSEMLRLAIMEGGPYSRDAGHLTDQEIEILFQKLGITLVLQDVRLY